MDAVFGQEFTLQKSLFHGSYRYRVASNYNSPNKTVKECGNIQTKVEEVGHFKYSSVYLAFSYQSNLQPREKF